MKKQVSQESGVLIGLAVSGLATVFGKKVVEAIKDKLSSQAITSIKNGVGSMQETDLVRYTQSARVEPILLMDKRAVNVPFISDVVQSLYHMFTGYYLMAISLDSTINGVSVSRRLDKFATDRDLVGATTSLLGSALESMHYSSSMESFGLPFIEEIQSERDARAVSMENKFASSVLDEILKIKDDHTRKRKLQELTLAQKIQDEGERQKAEIKISESVSAILNKTEPSTSSSIGTRESTASYVERVKNLAIGNVIDVNIEHDGKKVTIPITVRLRVAAMPSSTMVQTLAVGGTDVTTTSRFRAWRAGEIKFWADLVLQMDKVDAHRAAMMNDETGYYKTVYNRARNNSVAQVLGQGPSLGTASSIMVLTSQTAAELERKVTGRLDNFKVRQGIFGHTYSMLMAVIDPDWESITIYTRGIEMPTRLTANDIKMSSSKGTDSKDIMDILKAFQLGKAPGRL